MSVSKPESKTRRELLQATVVLSVVGVAAPLLAACENAQSTSGAPVTGSTPASSATPNAGAEGIVAVSDIASGGSVVKIVDDRKIIVTKSDSGQVHAFSAVCTHAGCTVKGVEEGNIVCVCHGSAFNPTTGAVVQGPAQTPLAVIDVQVRNGVVDFA